MPGNKMEMRVVEWKMEGSLKYTADWSERDRTSEKSGNEARKGRRASETVSIRKSTSIIHAREKGKKTERDRLSAEFYSGPCVTIPHSTPSENNGSRECASFHFCIRDHSCGFCLVFPHFLYSLPA